MFLVDSAGTAYFQRMGRFARRLANLDYADTIFACFGCAVDAAFYGKNEKKSIDWLNVYPKIVLAAEDAA